MKIKELTENIAEALHGAMKRGRRRRSIVFDSITDLSQALLRAKDAHSEFERSLGAKDYNWPLWYAAYMAMEQGLEEKSVPKPASSVSEVRPFQKMRRHLGLLVSFISGRWRSSCRTWMELF
jgi:hypothetical protein